MAKGAQLGTQDEVQTCLDGVLGRPEMAPKNDLELTQLQTRIFERLGVDLARFWGGFQRVLRSILLDIFLGVCAAAEANIGNTRL